MLAPQQCMVGDLLEAGLLQQQFHRGRLPLSSRRDECEGRESCNTISALRSADYTDTADFVEQIFVPLLEGGCKVCVR